MNQKELELGKQAIEACRALLPYADTIICYASTLSEHEGNRLYKMLSDVCEQARELYKDEQTAN